MDVLGIVPARGGSRAVPRKNLALLAGRPLIMYTFDAAKQSRRLTRTLLSTDDDEIAACGRACGIEVPFMRPPELATDATPSIAVVEHLLAELERREEYRPEIVVLLQPTSPLRRAAHIDAAVDRLIETGADSVVSVVKVPHQFNPVSVLRLDGDRVTSFLPAPASPVLRRQDKPEVYARNGAAVYAVRRATIAAGTFFGADCRALIMSPEDSIDIDDQFDLVVAEALLQTRRHA
jgi:CMP-N,N'-diacetyllegionaminic acid synthase